SAPRNLDIVASECDDRFVEISVRDHGPGMSAETAAKVFEAFYSTKSEGMGMGLAICRTIIESHGGRISLAPGHERGAVCRFTMPAVPGDLA
ncbi:MAG: PAS domain-containing sensor histidine kinase, partial [Planctomycetales bacterium]|nr:PAS domain-containing sensor histidine kinase [Planctomycetales bacterium]